MAAEHRVETELTLKDSVSEALHGIKHGFESVDEKVHETGRELVGMARQAIAVFAGFELTGVVDSVRDLGREVVGAAEGMEEQEKGIRGVLMMTDKAGESLETMTGRAHEFREQLEAIGVETGTPMEQLTGMFEELAERTGMSAEHVATLTERLAEAGRAVRGGPQALEEGFANMSAGIIRARNPVVQLIAATGELHGNARAVAQQLTKMSPHHAMQLGLDAISKMSEKMKGVPLSFGETMRSLRELREQVFESLGQPILAALGPPLRQLREWFAEHRELVQHWAEVVGQKVGEWVVEAVELFRQGVQYLEDHAEEIKNAVKEGFEHAKRVVEWILAHKAELAALLVAKESGVLGVAGSLAAKGAGALWSSGAATAATAAEEAGGGALGGAVAGGIGGAAALGAGAVAVASIAAAVYEFIQLWKETDGLKTESQMNWNAMADAITRDGANIDQASANMQEQLGVSAESMRSMGDEARAAAQKINEAIATLKAEAETAADIKKRSDERNYDIGLDAVAAASMRPMNLPEIAKKAASEKLLAPPVFDFRGSHFTIQQDFKDTDPDRLVVMMKDEFVRGAHSRLSAATQAPQTSF